MSVALTGTAAAGTTPAAATAVNQQALLALYLLTDYTRVGTRQDRPPSPSWIKDFGVVGGITSTSRRAALRLARIEDCLCCGAKLPKDTEGDHVIATDNGGPPGLENYLPLCGPCNSSKRTRDFLDWWIERKGRSVRELPHDALTIYCRLQFVHCNRLRTLSKDAPDSLRAAVADLLEDLGPEHERMLRARIGWITGRKWL